MIENLPSEERDMSLFMREPLELDFPDERVIDCEMDEVTKKLKFWVELPKSAS
jgi:hypothetical protein